MVEREILLSKLLAKITKINKKIDVNIKGLSSDSRAIKPGFLFVAYPGMHYDGRNYIDDAILKGAVAILYEEEGITAIQNKHKQPLIALQHLQHKLGEIAARFYDNPADKMFIVGITGTSGKTSCSQFLASALQNNNIPCGIIGTLGVGFPGELLAGVYTTPDPISLQQQLDYLWQKGAKAVSMEVSSQGLDQGRVNGVSFNVAVFTNLTREHLDYHGNMAAYGKAKRNLFYTSGLQHAVINVDDEFGLEIFKELSGKLNVFGYSIKADNKKAKNVLKATDIELGEDGFSAQVSTPWGEGVLKSNLLGEFNVSNLMAVLAVLGIMQVPLAKALTSLAKLTAVPGRLQVFGGGNKPIVVVDFAHKPEALKQVLICLKSHSHRSLWCVFGCGGDRDRGKRPIMGEIAEHYSDHLIITDDNPRTEDPQSIVEDIVKGLLCPWAVEIEHDRKIAIMHAINSASVGDIVLIAGKGHETYQIIGKEKIPFSDAEQVVAALAGKFL